MNKQTVRFDELLALIGNDAKLVITYIKNKVFANSRNNQYSTLSKIQYKRFYMCFETRYIHKETSVFL